MAKVGLESTLRSDVITHRPLCSPTGVILQVLQAGKVKVQSPGASILSAALLYQPPGYDLHC